MGIARDSKGSYKLTGKTTEEDVLAAAEGILFAKLERLGTISNPRDSGDFLRMRLGHLPYEVFGCLFLDNRHRILAFEEMFRGTVDGASVHPREVVRACIHHNAAAIICAHNHPSGVCQESRADVLITKELTEALRYIGVRVLDHLIVSADREPVSLAARGLI